MALVRKKKSRSGHRSSATRTMNAAFDIIRAGKFEAADMAKLAYYETTIRAKVDTLLKLDEEIRDATPEDELEAEIEQADLFIEEIKLNLIELEGAINNAKTTPSAGGATGGAPTTPPRLTPPTRSPPPSSTSSVAAEPPPPDSWIPATGVKLPKLTLKHFRGDPTTWSTFWDSFEVAVHENSGLSNVDKFNYLVSLLDPPASSAIAGLKITAANYPEAVALLKKRFGNKQHIISKHMDTLLAIEAVHSTQNLRGLRHLYDVVEAQVRGLKALGVPPQSYGALLSSVFLSKLPHDLRLQIARESSGSEEMDFERLLEITEIDLEAREKANFAMPPKTKPKPSHSTGHSLPSTGGPVPCCYCQQGAHAPEKCGKVVTLENRREILQKSGRCFMCLRKGHRVRECRFPGRCSHCNGRHHRSVCNKHNSTTTPMPAASSDLNPQAPTFTTDTSVTMSDVDNPVLLQTALAKVLNPLLPHCQLMVRILFDTGSQRSYVTNEVSKELSLQEKGERRLLMKTFGNSGSREQHCSVVEAGVLTDSGSVVNVELLSVPLICPDLTNQPVSRCKRRYKYLTHLKLADVTKDDSMKVDILIGADYYYEFITGNMIRRRRGPVAIETKLGWILSGMVKNQSHGDSQTMGLVATTHVLNVSLEGLDAQLQRFWDLESMGISNTEQTVYDRFEKEISFKDNRYEVRLPWKEYHLPLPSNYHLCLNRLTGLFHRLKRNPDILREYDSIIKEQLEKKIIEVVRDSDEEPPAVHYLAHHAVIRRDKSTTKVRVVYDASARTSGPSLNDCLYSGPKFGQNIMDIILRFRIHRIALVADIEKAFLMISISPEDRDVLRFLWVRDVNKEPIEPIIMRFTRVVFGVSSSPFLLNATLKHHLDEYRSEQPELVDLISRSIYVDDISLGTDDEDKAFEVYRLSRSLLAKGGFNLRKFVTNSPTLRDKIDRDMKKVEDTVSGPNIMEEDCSYIDSTLGVSNTGHQKVLGVCWDPSFDTIVFDLSSIHQLLTELLPTKRNIVGVATRFYDPLGFISPFTVLFKILFQELCKEGCEWDEVLSGVLLEKWKSIVANSLPVTISIPRHYFGNNERNSCTYRLVGFCDASQKAYAAVIYLCTNTGLSKFVASKTRVSPVNKKLTIPRLELLSSVLLARLVNTVQNALSSELKLGDTICYTDSKVALYWIKGVQKEWRQFVQNRVNEVRALVRPEYWYYCPGSNNPADLPSRGISPLELSKSMLWQFGPDWIHQPASATNEYEEVPTDCLSEVKSRDAHSFLTLDTMSPILDTHQFSSLLRLLRVTSIVRKVIQRFKGVMIQSKISANDIMDAEVYWIRVAQSTIDEKDFTLWHHQLQLFRDENQVWRCGGRIENASVSFSAKHPVILPRQHHFTRLVVLDAHTRVSHNGVKETLAEIRSRFWIVRGRQLVRQILHQCTICRKYEGRSFSAPLPPPLPEFRVTEKPPFTYTGVDYAGPLYIRNHESSQKVWVCLFTCCIVRAVHLELVWDMTAQAFIRALKRFTSRRGLPSLIVSDNSKTFKSSAKTLIAIFKHPATQHYLSGVRIEWQFNLEKAPWWGGMFERLVGSMKRCLRKTVGKSKLTFDELSTVITEVEGVLNSRPLSFVSTEDLEEPLTPAHFLLGRRSLSLPDSFCYGEESEDIDITSSALTKRMKHLNSTLERFWRRWTNEYLLELREAHRYSKGSRNSSIPTVGDIVLVHDEDKPRGFWKLSRIMELIVGSDGKIRGAIVRIGNKRLRRPLQKLYPLEVSQQDPPDSLSDSSNVTSDILTDITPRRSTRSTNQMTLDRMQACRLQFLDDN